MITSLVVTGDFVETDPKRPEKVPKGWWRMPLAYTVVGAAIGVAATSSVWYQTVSGQLKEIREQMPRPALHDVVTYANGKRVHFMEPAGTTVVAVSQTPQGTQSSCEIWVDGIKVVWHIEYQGGASECTFLVGDPE